MQQTTVEIKNKAGIHCRPSGLIMAFAARYEGHQFLVKSKAGQADLTSILDLLSLGLRQGDQVTLSVTGPRETEVCEKLAELFATEFDFV